MNQKELIDLKNTTFIIPLRIESADRLRNIELIAAYILDHFDTNIIIKESNTSQVFDNWVKPRLYTRYGIERVDECLISKFEQADSYQPQFHRTRLLNDMLMMSKTPVTVNYDSDILLPVQSYVKATKLCAEDYADLVYPYSFGDNVQKRVTWPKTTHGEIPMTSISNDPFEVESLDVLSTPWRAEYGFCQFFRTSAYISGYMENENFIAYGPEDTERALRWNVLGYKVDRVEGPVYHLEHSRTPNSSGANPFMRKNEAQFERLRKMSANELHEYYQNQQYVQDRLTSLK